LFISFLFVVLLFFFCLLIAWMTDRTGLGNSSRRGSARQAQREVIANGRFAASALRNGSERKKRKKLGTYS
jgi:hypothetical protein